MEFVYNKCVLHLHFQKKMLKNTDVSGEKMVFLWIRFIKWLKSSMRTKYLEKARAKGLK